MLIQIGEEPPPALEVPGQGGPPSVALAEAEAQYIYIYIYIYT